MGHLIIQNEYCYDMRYLQSYEYIRNIFNKQRKVIVIDLCYGDGTIHKHLSIHEFENLYNQMAQQYKYIPGVKPQPFNNYVIKAA